MGLSKEEYKTKREKGICVYSRRCLKKCTMGRAKCAKHLAGMVKIATKCQRKRRQSGFCQYGGCKKKSKKFVYCKKHKAAIRMQDKKLYDKYKVEVMSQYCGGAAPHCQCPGCDVIFIGFLQMDHIIGKGNQHRKRMGVTTLIRWLRKGGYPKGFQVLCANCNGPGGKGARKQCPLAGQPHHAPRAA